MQNQHEKQNPSMAKHLPERILNTVDQPGKLEQWHDGKTMLDGKHIYKEKGIVGGNVGANLLV